MKNLNNFASLGDHLPLWHFEEKNLIFNDGSMGVAFSLKGTDISTATHEVINNFCSQLENLLNSLEDGLRLQIFYRLSSDIAPLIDAHELEAHSMPEASRAIVDSRINFFRTNMKAGNFYWPEIYFFIRSKPYNFKKKSFFGKSNKFEQVFETEFLEHKDNFERSVSQITEHFESLDLAPKQLSSEEWFKLIFNFFNLERSEKIGVPKLRTNDDTFSPALLEQMLLSDTFVHQDCIQIENQYFKVINLGLLPDKTVASMADGLTKLPFHYWLSQTIEINIQQKETEKLQLKRRMAYSMAAGAKNVSDLEAESKLSNLEGLLKELVQGNEKIMTMGLVVIIWDKDKKELTRKADKVLRELKSMNQAEGVCETLASFDVFTKAWPGSCESFRSKKLKTSNASHLMPLFSYWTGNQRPVCLLPNRDSVPFCIDPFAPELPNWNGLVIGGSGAGKSFTLCQLMLQFYSQNPRPKIVFVDNGKSSENFVASCNGEFIDVSIDSGICLNPFDLGENETKPTTLKIKLILAALELILKDEQNSLPKREKALLEECVYQLYEESSGTPTLSDLKNKLLKHEVETLKRFGQILYSWTGETAYGKLLDGKSNIGLKNDITAIEVKGLDDFPELKDVFMLLITNFVQREAERDLTCPYILICDEAHRLFKTPSTRDYILYCYRVFRKYNCSIFCITQNYKDFLSIPEVADAIFPNTTHVFILRQRKIDWADFQRIFDFNGAELIAIKSLRIKKREFSEMFYMQDEKRAILKIIPDSLSYWVCTSDGKDKAKIQHMKVHFPDLSVLEILQKLSSEKNQSTEPEGEDDEEIVA
jgi:type IV secretory pathway VirB4 component